MPDKNAARNDEYDVTSRPARERHETVTRFAENPDGRKQKSPTNDGYLLDCPHRELSYRPFGWSRATAEDPYTRRFRIYINFDRDNDSTRLDTLRLPTERVVQEELDRVWRVHGKGSFLDPA